MAHENGDKQRPNKRRHVQGMLDETDPSKGTSGRWIGKVRVASYELRVVPVLRVAS